jgi:copper oxidase (laccase) domain-containing protein
MYGGVDPKPVFSPPKNQEKYTQYPSEEVQAVSDALNDHGRQSLKAARAAFVMRHLNWLGLASKDDLVFIEGGQPINRILDVEPDEFGSFMRSPATDIGVVGPRRDNDGPITLAMGVADCLAIPIVDERNEAFGFAHAGRPGTGLRTAEIATNKLIDSCGSNPRDLIAYLGEGVCGACYLVDERTFDGFVNDFGGKVEVGKVVEQYPDSLRIVKGEEGDKFAIDLYAFNKYLLAQKEVREIVVAPNCTARADEDCISVQDGVVPDEKEQAFFSHERAKGKLVGFRDISGNMMEFNTFDLTTPRNLAAITRL